jgi:hypothetical protein
MNIDQRDIELKEIPTPRKLRKPAHVEVDVGSAEFFRVLASANNKIIENIELNNPDKSRSILISSDIEGALDIIKPILIKNFREKGWQLNFVDHQKREGIFDGEYTTCLITIIDTRSLLVKFLNVKFSELFACVLAALLAGTVIVIPVIFIDKQIRKSIAPVVDLTGQLIKVNGGVASFEGSDGSVFRIVVGANDVISEEKVGKCFRHVDESNKFGGKKSDIIDCRWSGFHEYGEDDGAFGELVKVSKHGSCSKVQLTGSTFLVVDEPSHSKLRQNTGKRFRYNDYRAGGGERILTEILQ